ncbi:MAG: response regulator [Nitrospira sp.]|nr:response regulator [Nitrospira sp.]
MTRFERTPTPLVYGAIVLSSGAVFISGLLTELGIAVWVFYILPLVFSYLTWKPLVPAYTAMATTLLILVGFFLSSHGIDPFLAMQNRIFGVATSWALAALGYQFITNKLTVRKQEWLQSGQTLLSERMAGDPNIDQLGSRVIGTIAEYLDVPAGALFIENGPAFRRTATYGVPADARLPLEVRSGDGLLGRALVEHKVIVVPDVPEGYLTIGSSLGRSAPRHLLIAPLAAEHSIKAVLELGFLHPVNEADKEFVTRVSESIAVAIRSAQARVHILALLEETRRQAEELQAKSEELRAANEELTERSASLEDSHGRLEKQQVELERSNAQLEEQTAMLEAQNDELTRAKSDVEAQARELEQAGRYKSEFLANMSHELRTPLNALLILARQLGDNADGNLTRDQVANARNIESAGRDLLALINEVLDLAKVEAGRMEVHPLPVCVAALAQHVTAMFQPVAEDRGLSLRVRLADEMPETIETDQQRLEQVLNNLLSNAIKFTDQGEVRLEISRASDGRIAFAVRDTGIGITDHQHQAIFEPFHQADGTINRKYGGTGLGLSIARKFTRLLGGEIRLTSAPGQGSTFTALLPERYKAASEPVETSVSGRLEGHFAPTVPDPGHARIPDDRERLSGDRRVVLIVEDDPTQREAITALLTSRDVEAVGVGTAADCLDQLGATRFDCMVLDVSLPDEKGYALLETLTHEEQYSCPPVVIYTGRDLSPEEEQRLRRYAKSITIKGVKSPERLLDEVTLFLHQVVADLPPVPQTLLTRAPCRDEDLNGVRLLVVEDDVRTLFALMSLLEPRGAKVQVARNGREALTALEESFQSEGAPIDLVLMDIMMPKMDGLTAMREIRKRPEWRHLPIIALTSKAMKADRQQALTAGADDCMTKPLEVERLVSLVRSWMPK